MPQVLRGKGKEAEQWVDGTVLKLSDSWGQAYAVSGTAKLGGTSKINSTRNNELRKRDFKMNRTEDVSRAKDKAVSSAADGSNAMQKVFQTLTS